MKFTNLDIRNEICSKGQDHETRKNSVIITAALSKMFGRK
jgi:hypothetical protein